ncbi:MAG TPA: hypothetical protein VL360_05780 [Gammaproteobacteria bacterium]|nr:hypothetical protein [Gammaproteobacteria bacterium]
MRNRHPNDYSIDGITQNIAELDRIPGMLSQLEIDIREAGNLFTQERNTAIDFLQNKIPYKQREINAVNSRIQMLELPGAITSLQDSVKADEKAIIEAASVRDKNVNDVSPYVYDIKKISHAIGLQDKLSELRSHLSVTKSKLKDNEYFLTSQSSRLEDLKQQRSAASQTADSSLTIFNSINNDYKISCEQHRREEEPEIAAIQQLRHSLSLQESNWQQLLDNKAQSEKIMQNAYISERHQQDKANSAKRATENYDSRAKAARARKQQLTSEHENQRRAYEAAKQTVANSNNGGGYSSSGGSTPATSFAAEGGYSSNQVGSNSNGGYSSSVSNPGKELADIESRISDLERSIRSADDEANECERNAVKENSNKLEFETNASNYHRLAIEHANAATQSRQQAQALESGIAKLRSDIQVQSDQLKRKQEAWLSEEKNLQRQTDSARSKYKDHANKVERLDAEIQTTVSEINDTKEKIRSNTSEINNINSNISATDSKLKEDGYASKFPSQELQKRLQIQSDLAKPFQLTIQECERKIQSTSAQKRANETEIINLQQLLDAHTAHVAKSKDEFTSVCDSTDTTSLKEQLTCAESEKQNLDEQLKKQQQVVDTRRSEFEDLRDNQRDLLNRQKALQSSFLLMNLYNDPQKMLDDLHNQLLTKIQSYADTHHQDLTWQTRRSLMTLGDRANFIYHNENVAGKTDNDIPRNKYYQLAGLIREEIQKLSGNEDYIKTLISTLEDPCVESTDVREQYTNLAKQYPEQLKILTEEDVLQQDNIEYHQAKNAFDNMLARGPQDNSRDWRQFYAAGKKMSECIHEQATRRRKANEPEFDKRLHTRIFVVAQEVLAHPENVVRLRQLHALTENNTIGKPSTARKVIGAILAFLGGAAAIIGGLALAGVLPIISLPIAIPLIAGGGVSLVAGASTLFSARHRGLSKSYANYEEIADKVGKNHHPAAAQVDEKLHTEYFETPSPSAPTL